jgi:hypothetical protein
MLQNLCKSTEDHIYCLRMSTCQKGDFYVSVKHAEISHTRCTERPTLLYIVPSCGNNRNSCCQDFDILLALTRLERGTSDVPH